jgi:hypothetical protein
MLVPRGAQSLSTSPDRLSDRRQGLTDEEIERVPNGPTDEGWSSAGETDSMTYAT